MADENKFHRFIDRRKYPRINASVSYSITDNQNFFIPQSSKNIGSGGIAFFAREKLSVAAILDLVILILKGLKRSLYAYNRTCYSSPC